MHQQDARREKGEEKKYKLGSNSFTILPTINNTGDSSMVKGLNYSVGNVYDKYMFGEVCKDYSQVKKNKTKLEYLYFLINPSINYKKDRKKKKR